MPKIDKYVEQLPENPVSGSRFWYGATLGIVCGILAAMIPTLALAVVLLLVGRYGIKLLGRKDKTD